MPRELDTFIDSELDESALQAFIQGTGSEHYFGTQGRQKSVYRVDRQGVSLLSSPSLFPLSLPNPYPCLNPLPVPPSPLPFPSPSPPPFFLN